MSLPRPRRLSGVTQPQEDVVTSTKTRVNKISTVVVPVSDQDRAIAFYVETLGFEKRIDVPSATATSGSRWPRPAGAQPWLWCHPRADTSPAG